MSIPFTDVTTTPRGLRLRAAASAALLLALAVALVTLSAVPSQAASRKKATRLIEPTSVTVADTTCTDLGDGTWDVTVTFKVTGGRYLNLGEPETSSSIVNSQGSVRYDNVRGGGTRFIDSTVRYLYNPLADEDGDGTVGTFTYQHAIAAVTPQGTAVSLRTTRLLSRDFEVTFTCA